MYSTNFNSPPTENSLFLEGVHSKEWTCYENKLFEKALAELDLTSPYLFEKIMAILPWKTLEEIKNHYQQLIADVALIEKGQIPIPNYGRVNGPDHKRKGVSWTEEEHKMFLIGLDKYGKGDWKSISRHFVQTKTASQVASHAQKYFRRMKCGTPLEKRRYSIHDIRIINSAIVESPARHPNHHAFIAHIPRDHRTNDIIIDPPSSIMSTKEYNSYYYAEASSGNNNNGSTQQVVASHDQVMISGSGMDDGQCPITYDNLLAPYCYSQLPFT